MSKKKFPKFWYESNACWGWVESVEDLNIMLEKQIDPKYGGLKNKDEFLDFSKEDIYHEEHGYDGFGTRIEHRGPKTLREFLEEHKIKF